MNEPVFYVECPACAAVFRVPAALHDAPRARCGECGHAFDLLPARVHEPWGTRARPEGVAGAEGEVIGAPSAPAGPTPRPAVPLRANSPVELPPAGPSLARVLGGGAVLVVLLAALVVQLAWFNRDALAAHPLARPAVHRLCSLAGCTLPAWRDLDAFALEGARMSAHPDHAGALVAAVNMRNDAPFGQAAPVLVLRLRDAGGRPVGARAFQPVEYLAPDQAGRVIAPGEILPVRLVLADVPGARDFTMRLRW